MSPDLNSLIRFSRKKPHDESLRGRYKGHIGSVVNFEKSQKVIVKNSYIKPTLLDSHIAYLKRDGVGKDGSRPEMFTDKDREINLDVMKNEKHIFKHIISPENASQIDDLQSYTRDIMETAEKNTGNKLDWVAVVHYNTDHPHIHIMVRGITRDGKELTFDPRYMKYGLRNIAENRATKELGERSQKEIDNQQIKERTAERFTSIDRDISKSMNSHINISSIYYPENKDQKERLKYLSRHNFAIDLKTGSYELVPGWEKKLKDLSIRNDIIKRMQTKKMDDSIKYTSIDKMKVKGTIVKKGYENETYMKPYIVIKNEGRLYYHSDYKLKNVEVGQKIEINDKRIRTEKDLSSIDAPKFTKFDFAIKERANEQRQIITSDKNQIERLDYLVKVGLGESISKEKGMYKLAKDWEYKFKDLSRLTEAAKNIKNPTFHFETHDKNISGEIVSKGSDKKWNKPYVIIRDGSDFYIRSDYRLKDVSLNQEIKIEKDRPLYQNLNIVGGPDQVEPFNSLDDALAFIYRSKSKLDKETNVTKRIVSSDGRRFSEEGIELGQSEKTKSFIKSLSANGNKAG